MAPKPVIGSPPKTHTHKIDTIQDACKDKRARNYATQSSNITSIKRYCNGKEACSNAANGSYVVVDGNIVTIQDTCNGVRTCHSAVFYGDITNIEGFCNGKKACFRAANTGNIGTI